MPVVSSVGSGSAGSAGTVPLNTTATRFSSDTQPAAGTEPDRLPTIASDTQNRTFNDYENPIPQVVNILREMGIDASGMKMERWDEVVANWGGHYTNHYIRVEIGNGINENFSLEYTIRNPKITAVEIARLLRGGPVIS